MLESCLKSLLEMLYFIKIWSFFDCVCVRFFWDSSPTYVSTSIVPCLFPTVSVWIYMDHFTLLEPVQIAC